MKSGFIVHIIESEAGWGQKVDDVRYFRAVENADNFVKTFNSENTCPVTPDWYMYAQEAQFSRSIPNAAKFEDD